MQEGSSTYIDGLYFLDVKNLFLCGRRVLGLLIVVSLSRVADQSKPSSKSQNPHARDLLLLFYPPSA